MEFERLVKQVRDIEMPEEMRERIVRNCLNKKSNRREKKVMNFKKALTIAAAFVLCIGVTGVGVLAATENLKGFFKDITNWNGTVVGTTYEQASDELNISVVGAEDELDVQIIMVEPNKPPYITFDEMGIGSYKIVDASGNVVFEGNGTDRFEITDGQVNVNIPMENIADGAYTLIVNSFVGASKADQPLEINGLWECEFTR